MHKRLLALLLSALLPLSATLPVAASAYDAHPKLVVILVIDQFREDYLERYRSDFKGHGFRLFLDNGAYFPDCYFDYANTKTAPGHATIGTGAYSDGHGISSNEWWDLSRNTKRPISSVEDPRYQLVGLPNGQIEEGASPRNLLATTLGDEVRLATKGEAKLYGLSLKDRAAILLSGHSANGAFWIDPASGRFITSSYYMASLPDWATTFDNSDRATQARTEAGASADASFYKTVGPTPAAISYELDFARALIKGEKLGSDNVTDVLTISISSTDILGHAVGPDSLQQEELVDQLDVNLDQFFTWLDKNIPGGLRNVWIALSADHGIAPIPSAAAQLGIPAATINVKAFALSLNEAMNQQFSPGQQLPYMLPDQELPYMELNEPVFERAGVNEHEAERAVQQAIPAALADVRKQQNAADATSDATTKPSQTRLSPEPEIFRTFTREQMGSLEPGLPPTEFGSLIAHSYSPNGGWYVMVIPEAYQMGSVGRGTTHYSPYSYDRHVPLGFYGTAFAPGTYYNRVEPVDIAATLAALLEVNQPSASVGHVLTVALRPEHPAIPERHRRAVSPKPAGKSADAPPAAAGKTQP
ncbi:MAG TPA: alkaline phosphatase family protein [Acidobacteriaceae bacterium]|jgi:predicted AlkP superfamily pyrophosphatase or phosphodiesterase|nr:alkaline phosphatase family protein [Acidobacteriaceae bacterium]